MSTSPTSWATPPEYASPEGWVGFSNLLKVDRPDANDFIVNYCAKANGVRQAVEDSGVPLLDQIQATSESSEMRGGKLEVGMY